jgi:hypothetical protein
MTCLRAFTPLCAALALVPVMIGPLPAQAAAMTVTLCNGGTITIPLGKGSAPGEDRDCHPKGCHAGSCRQKDAEKRPNRAN